MQGRKQRRQLVMQSLRLMILSGVVRPAASDPPYLAVPKAPPSQPQAEQPPPAGSAGSIGRVLIGLLAFLTISIWSGTPAEAVRVKDVASIEGVRENQLIGYGLVVGLDRTGDQVIGGQFTIQAMMSMLNKMGINLVIDPIQLLTRNIASVMVTAESKANGLGHTDPAAWDRAARDLTKAGFYPAAPNVKAAYTTEFKSGVTP